MLALVMAGCKKEEPSQVVSMPVSVCLSADDVMSARNAAPIRRAIGDPGTTERFLFPHYLYIIIMRQDPGKATWTLWQAIKRTLTDEDWTPGRYEEGPLSYIGDSIYRYNDQINLLLTNGTLIGRQEFVGRVFAVASAVELELTFNQALTSIANMDQALGLTFSTSTETIQNNLQHIYSTPYNYEVGGKYYGEFSSVNEKVPQLNLLLYHVAAKVDIKWSVAESLRINKDHPENAIRLTYMQARNLFNGNAYCFKPMENTNATPLASGYSREIITAGNEGLWWEGRYYFYTIPYTIEQTGERYFPLQMVLKTNGSTSAGYRPTLKMKVDTSSPFVPWMRANFRITAPLTDKTETMIINND